MTYCFDLDETLCIIPYGRYYGDAVPYKKIVETVNSLFEKGNEIKIFTSRGTSSGVDYRRLTESQLKEWGVKYHDLIMGKPSYDIFVDDRAINVKEWRRNNGIKITGFVASSFDLLHAGHVLYLKEASQICDVLIAALHDDPSVERTNKNKPIQTLAERKIQLEGCRYIDIIEVYKTEKDLEHLIRKYKPDVRIVGSDAKNNPITGETFSSCVYYHSRNHAYSSSELRERIKNEC